MKAQQFLPMICLAMFPIIISAQTNHAYQYDISSEHPYGLPNPEAPSSILDWAELIGTCDCVSESRNPDQTWADPIKMIWTFKYIMNGKGVQDETLKEDGGHSGSIRQFIADSNRWFVHYYSSSKPSTSLSAWEGNRDGDKIILYNDQTAPNGMEGWYKINFTDISYDGFNWLGEWVNKDETVSYPTWKISCTKRKAYDHSNADEIILNNIAQFSRDYMDGNYAGMANAYTIDGKIFPNNASIIEGRKAIEERWVMPEGTKILHHKATPEELTIIGKYAYDYGYYEGKTMNQDQTESSWKGKYVIVWKKVDDDWKMYLDIWNRVKD